MTTGIFLLAGLLAVPAPAWSDQDVKDKGQAATQPKPQPRKWWQDDKYRSALGLSPAQVARIDRLYEEHSAVQRQLWSSLEESEREVSRLMAADPPQEALVVAAIERTELLRYKINERRALFLFRIRQQLSVEQHRKLEKLHEQGRSERGRSGHGHQSRHQDEPGGIFF